MKDYLKKYPYLLLIPITLCGLSFLFFQKEEETIPQSTIFSTTDSQSVSETTNIVNQEWYVDVKGAVNSTGMYRIKEGMRLMDVIELAGGFTAEADQNQINFSKLLTDQEIVYIPKVGEEMPSINEETNSTQSNTEHTNKKININTADATELQQLSGIGEKRAADIINYR
ncbi:SLBB domain-containing protein [Enterococcus hermanniensis]|uniref:Soluble ligand binding domain-containing protein n=1 Tax=Enterococcus hermanniensis TaxID=249189 RepID=A0A1L8TFF0_9ENTE|nr:SLBB domain-containing protein [Enterococcus hermanniensis]OJG42976.1 hypothetical protein RV04_GL000735 [Enterococcus hermanniensis]